MQSRQQSLCARSKGSIDIFNFSSDSPKSSSIIDFENCRRSLPSGENAKQSRISDDGKRLVTVFIDEVAVFDLNDNSKVWHIPVKNAADACISPLGTWCATFERLAGEISESNIKFWLLSDNLQVTRKMAFTHKAANTWMPSWTSDEKLMGRMLVNELQSFDVSCPQDENLSTSKPFLRIKADNISSFAFSPDPNQKFVAVFTRNSASTMAAVRVYSLSTPADDFLSKPAVFKVFAKAEKCTLMWSPNGRYLLALAQTEVDASGVSYYGETHLYFLAADGTSDCRVSLDAEGPIHDVAWSPDSDAFVTIYGYMPGRAILFSAPKCQARFTFAVGAKNWVRWNPQGSLLCFAAFGNLPGHVEIWHRPKGSFSGETTGSSIRRVGSFTATGSATCFWSPDGTMLVTATLTPRLRVDNGFRVWNWNGNLLGSVSYTELYSLVWRPDPSLVALDLVTEVLPAVTENFCGEKLSTEQPMPKVAAYKPPGMRAGGSFVSSFKEDGSPTIANASIGKGKTIVKKGNGAELKAPKKVEELQETNPISVPLTPGEKAIKKLRAKIEQITRLKELQASGAMLEVNQLEKIRGEGAIREELASAIANESRTKL